MGGAQLSCCRHRVHVHSICSQASLWLALTGISAGSHPCSRPHTCLAASSPAPLHLCPQQTCPYHMYVKRMPVQPCFVPILPTPLHLAGLLPSGLACFKTQLYFMCHAFWPFCSCLAPYLRHGYHVSRLPCTSTHYDSFSSCIFALLHRTCSSCCTLVHPRSASFLFKPTRSCY